MYDTHLKFYDYISKITSRAYQRIGLILRGFTSKNTELLRKAFIVYVRPILEYCTCVWSPHLLKDVHKLENVQRYFIRRLFPGCSFKYADRLLLLNLDSLESRRLKFDLKMYYEILNNLISIDPATLFLFGPMTGMLRGHNPTRPRPRPRPQPTRPRPRPRPQPTRPRPRPRPQPTRPRPRPRPRPIYRDSYYYYRF